MSKKKLLLADTDEGFLRELSYYFMERVPQFELVIFTEPEKMFQYLETNGQADVVMVDEELAGERLSVLTEGRTRIALSTGKPLPEGYGAVKKFQRLEALASAVLVQYAEDSNTLDTIRGNSDTRITCFYSPGGGTGKTVLSLAAAAAAAKMGFRTLYLNLEEIDSISDCMGKTPGNLSDLYLSLKTKGRNAGVRLKGALGVEPSAGFSFVSGVESVSEYEEINGEDMEKLFGAVRELAAFDLVIVDLSSGFGAIERAALREADRILVPAVPGTGLSKLERILKEAALHDRYEPLIDKMSLVINRASGRNDMGRIPGAVKGRIPCCACVMESAVLADLSSILRSGSSLVPVMEPVVQTAMELVPGRGGRP